MNAACKYWTISDRRRRGKREKSLHVLWTLNETARSYKMIAEEAKTIDGFCFVWVTDGGGRKSARRNLEETFNVLDSLYNIADTEKGVFSEIFK